MFALGGSSLAPLDRHLTPPMAGIREALSHVPQPGRALIVGGATTPLVERLLASGQSVTIAEPAHWGDEAEKIWPTAEVVPFDSWTALDDFPLGWFSRALLLGGVTETGGPWWNEPAAGWSGERPAALARLLTLVADGGRIIADHSGILETGRLMVVARGGNNGQTSISFATELDDSSVALTTHRYRSGVEDIAELRIVGRAPWDRLADSLLVSPIGPNACSIAKLQGARL